MSENKLKLGLTMAGAVSAGAYTAGVIDYLLETLDQWEEAKSKNRSIGKGNPGYDDSIPMHDISIEVMSGASAGGITSIVAAAAIQQKFESISPDKRDEKTFGDLHKKNPLYHTWVNLTRDDMVEELFDTSDVTGKISSLLNSGFKKKIADRVLQPVENPIKRPYFSDDLDVIVTLTSLNGIPFELGFASNANSTNVYRASSHRDFAHFKISDQGYSGDGRIPIDFRKTDNFDMLKNAAMATGAFPVGLAARSMERERKYVEENPYINPLAGMSRSGLHLPEKFKTLNSDGGILNNEPFDVARKILAAKLKGVKAAEIMAVQTDKPIDSELHFVNEHEMEGTIIMIDPFPSETTSEFDFDDGILSMIGKVLGAMRGELLFKKEDLELAYKENNFSRFLIAPKRSGIQGSAAIACGSLGGFGGFFMKEFRKHDFYLGRRNAQQFLRRNFAVSADTQNKVISSGYTDAAKNRFAIVENDGVFMPIIPDLGYNKNDRSANAEPAYVWPTYPESALGSLREHVAKRTEAILKKMLGEMGVNSFTAWTVSKVGKGTVTKKVVEKIEKGFRSHNLMR